MVYDEKVPTLAHLESIADFFFICKGNVSTFVNFL